jgi:predicted ATPase/class 3 adenylate cyclase
MLCRYCDSDNSATSAFCSACGKPLGLACIACGHVNRPDSRFCGKCSKPLEPAAPISRPGAEILKALSVSGGERKRLTLLFADIVNSTGLIERYDPEDAMRRLQPTIDAMKGAVDRHGGGVIRIQGDGILALFGAPRSHEDHALRACAAALAMQASIAALGDSDLRIRVGLHTGVVVAQAVENSLHYLTYEVAGPAAHLAARMEQMADPGDILLTGDTVAATRQSVEAVSLGKRAIRGLTEPVEVYRLLDIRNAPASVIFRSRPQLSTLIGRSAEFEALNVELANASNGEARAVGIGGAAGAGKSRLCFEFAESCRSRGFHVHEARVLAHAHATAYQPIIELLRDYLGLKAGQPPDAARRQVATAIANLPAANDTLPLLLEFLGLSDASHPAPRLDPAVRKTRLLELVRNIVRSGRRNEPAVILVEDLHWVDAASGEFVEAMVDAVVGTTTLLLLNFRSDYAAPWMRHGHYRQITLSPLSRAGMGDLLSELLGRDPSVAEVANDIAERAQGNPFFAEELIHTLVEGGNLEGERGAYRLARAIDTIPLPATIEALLAARIDRLDETARRILQCAAVIGCEVPAAILESVSGLPPAGLAEPLKRLRQAELLRELSGGQPGLHAFSHPLIQEVCTQSLLRERRRKIHADVARALKLRSTDPWEERTSLLAYHLEEAGEFMEAAQATIRSALWVGAHDSSQALRSWKKVHQLLTALPPSESTDWLRVNACLQIMGLGWREGLSIEEARSRFEEAREIALATNNLRANAWAHAAFGRNLAVAGSADDYVARVREATALAIEAGDGSSEVMLKAALSQALRLAGHAHEALQANIEATERVHEINEFDRQLMGFAVERWLIAMRGQILVLLGRFDEARPYLDRMLQADGDPHDITQHLASVAYVDLAWGEDNLTLAAQHAERASSLAVQSGSPYVSVSAQTCRGLSHMMSGRFADAVDELEKALVFARARRAGMETEARLLADLANARRLNGDLDGARRTASEAIEVAGERAARIPECLARIVLAEAALTAGDANRAALELPKVRALLKETGAKLYEPMMHDLAARIDAGTAALAVGTAMRAD